MDPDREFIDPRAALIPARYCHTRTYRSHRCLTLVLYLALLPINLFAQDVQVIFSGYALHLPVYQHVDPNILPRVFPGGDAFLDLSRIRLRPALFVGDNTSVMMEYELTAFYDSRDYSFASPGGTPGRQLTGLRWEITADNHLRVTHFFDRLYVRHDFTSSSVVIGRQRISWGTGRVWNPTDLFNPINPASFDKIEKDGADAISFKHYFGNFTDLELVWNPEDEFLGWNGGGRFRTNFMEYDVSVMGGRFDGRGVVGADFAGNLFTTGIRGEVLYAEETSAGPAGIILVAGIDYQFTTELYCLAEYLHNGLGASHPDGYNLITLFSGDILQLGRNYLTINSSCLVHPLITGTVGVTLNLEDESGFVLPQISWSARQNLELGLGGLIVFGEGGSEYRYYPTSLYGKITAFF